MKTWTPELGAWGWGREEGPAPATPTLARAGVDNPVRPQESISANAPAKQVLGARHRILCFFFFWGLTVFRIRSSGEQRVSKSYGSTPQNCMVLEGFHVTYEDTCTPGAARPPPGQPPGSERLTVPGPQSSPFPVTLPLCALDWTHPSALRSWDGQKRCSSWLSWNIEEQIHTKTGIRRQVSPPARICVLDENHPGEGCCKEEQMVRGQHQPGTARHCLQGTF